MTSHPSKGAAEHEDLGGGLLRGDDEVVQALGCIEQVPGGRVSTSRWWSADSPKLRRISVKRLTNSGSCANLCYQPGNPDKVGNQGN
jgi:hypothetical protein